MIFLEMKAKYTSFKSDNYLHYYARIHLVVNKAFNQDFEMKLSKLFSIIL